MWIAAFIVLIGAGSARAQDLSAIPDSLIDFRYKFIPIFEMTSKGGVVSNELGARFNNTIIGANGLTVTTVLSVNEKKFRLQDRSEKNKQFNNTVSKSVWPGFILALGHSDARQVSRAAIASGGVQDFVLNNESLNGTATYISPTRYALGWDARTALIVRNNEFAFKTDEGQGGQVNAGVRGRFLDGRVRVIARTAYEDFSEKSSSIFTTFDGLSTSSDSLLTAVDLKVTDSLDVNVNWTDYSFERIFADQTRSATGIQDVGAENLFRETEKREFRRYGVRMKTTPLRGLSLEMNALHSEQISDYVNTPSRYSRVVSDELRGNLSYRMKSGTAVSLKMENLEALRDLGTESLSSFFEKRKKASLSLQRKFTETFNIELSMAQGITQAFYLRFEENPRDRDQLDSSIRARVSSSPFPKIQTALFLSIASTDFVSIHKSQSENNRNRLRYDFQPTITYTMHDRLRVEQGYGLAIEFADFDFDETQNFLDRNVTFWNRVNHKPTRRVSTEFYYALTLHDRGSYLPDVPGGERFLDVDREDRTDQTKTSVRFAINPHLTLVAAHNYSRRRDETVGSGSARITTDGGIEGGVLGNYRFGTKGDLTFSLERTERFSPFGTDKQKKFWDANLSFKYSF